ncbi:maleate cis-trans isomerase family protein [Roseomonas rosulenta]|uniref:maleate cis-trans isomerase family protein n=1 Tax=Roseomonas rosulenta TaxID=2748667 RepID=UPI0018DF0BB5
MSAIDYGERARIGFLVPSGNQVCEAELHAMMPPGVAALVTRLELRGSSEPELLRMVEALEPASRLLADARPALLAFHCTAVSTFAPAMAADIPKRMTAATNLPATTTADGILAAFAALGARRVLLVTPYIAEVHAREVDFLAAHGIDVVGGSMLGLNTNAEMAALPPERIREQARAAAAASPGAQAFFISCTAIRSAPLIAPLEAELGMPVVTSNQIMAWHAMRRCGIADAVPGFGHLLTLA